MSHVLPSRSSSSAAAPGIAVRHILWSCDFSPCSSGALRFVIPLARAYGSDLTALHVIPTTVPPGAGAASLTNPALLRPHLHHEASASLDRFVSVATEASVPTSIALREGKPVDEILGLAESLRADLLVLGTRGQSAVDRLVLGSVAEAIIVRARCPVLVVPTGASPPSGLLFRTVLWATDFSPHATLAWRYALSLAAKSQARLLLLHVLEGDALRSDAERVREMEQRLQETVAAGRDAGCEAEVIVTNGSASGEVLRVARERAAELVVMGVQGARALHTLFFGSTAQRVCRDASCAVLTVRRT